VAAII